MSKEQVYTRSIIICIIMSFYSCKKEQQNNLNHKSDTVTSKIASTKTPINKIIYTSSANGVADIKLTIDPDGLFSYYMEIIPQPMTDDEIEVIKATGTWTKENQWLFLSFDTKEIHLTSLFDINYAKQDDYKFINDYTIGINSIKKEISIWGVNCNKTLL